LEYFVNKLLDTVCSLIAGIALFAIMVLTFFDVTGRKLLDHSIPGSLELTELFMVVVIFGALPLVSRKGEHVVFDSLDGFWPKGFVKFQKALVNLLCSIALLALGWLMLSTGIDFASFGETTAQLKISKAPFIMGMGFMCALAGIVHLILVFRPLGEDEESEGGVL
jgi:TRAP-type C4-dicarboxylate transport system permease small subunit